MTVKRSTDRTESCEQGRDKMIGFHDVVEGKVAQSLLFLGVGCLRHPAGRLCLHRSLCLGGVLGHQIIVHALGLG